MEWLQSFKFKESAEAIAQDLHNLGVTEIEHFAFLDKDFLKMSSLSPMTHQILLRIKDQNNHSPSFQQAFPTKGKFLKHVQV